MRLENARKISVDIIIFSSALILIIFLMPKLLVMLAPFIIAYFISKAVVPLSDILYVKFKIPKKIGVVLLLTAIITALFLILLNLFYQAIIFLQSLSDNLPAFFNGTTQYPAFVKKILKYYDNLPVSKQIFIDKIVSAFKDNINVLLKSTALFALGEVKNLVSLVPSAAIFTTVLFLASYFFSTDTKRIKNALKTVLPEGFIASVKKAEDRISKAFGGYAKAQLILMSITFVILFIGFSFLNIPYSALLALVTALIDSLPILGTGIVLLPWSGFNLLIGNYKTSVWIIIIYLSAMLTRQIAEPKIVSSKIGLHPILTLISMYVFLKLFGIVGMILGPLAVLIIIAAIK